jgi:hypothetical protein
VGPAMNPNTILKSIGRIYDNVEIALWSMMLSFVIYFFVFIVPKLPEIRDWAEQVLAKEIAAENAYYCEKFGMEANTQIYEQCLLDLGDFRLKVENRIYDEYDF